MLFVPISNYIFIVILRTTYVAHSDNKIILKLYLNLVHKIGNYKTNIQLCDPLIPGLFIIITIDNYSEKYVAENKWPRRNL